MQVGENVQLGRAVRYDVPEGSTVENYVHFGHRIGVLIEIEGEAGDAAETARGIAMHIAATNPAGISPDDIPGEVIERERAIFEEQAREQGKPPEIAARIVEGRMRKFFEENALLWQSYVRDPERRIKDLLEEGGRALAVRRFARFEIGA